MHCEPWSRLPFASMVVRPFDAYLSKVGSTLIGLHSADSVLRSLEYANVSDENLKISEIIEAERGLTEKERMFLAELNLPSLDLIVDYCRSEGAGNGAKNP